VYTPSGLAVRSLVALLEFGKTNYMRKVEEVIDLPCFKIGGVVHIRQKSSISRYDIRCYMHDS
jgi:hypothetical protein